MEDKKKKRGGYRPGSGRPTTGRKMPLMVRISEKAYNKLNDLTDNKSEYIDNLIMQQST